MANNLQKQVQEIATSLLTLIGIQGEIDVSQDESETLIVSISTEQAGILIGRHGETISAFQLILNQIIFKQTGEWMRVIVNCGDYQERQKEMMFNLARTTAETVRDTGKPQPLYDLTANQRRLVHMALAEDSYVATKSEGEGRERHLVVEPKQ